MYSRQAGRRKVEPYSEEVDQCQRAILACNAVESVGNRRIANE